MVTPPSDSFDDDKSDLELFIEQRNLYLKDIPREIIHEAWFTLSHMLLNDGARVADMGCGDGMMTYAMAAMAPNMRFTGVDKSKRHINKARALYELDNLDYEVGDVASDIFSSESLDGIINSFVIHEIYSDARYNERAVVEALSTHFKALKKYGVMFLRDHIRAPEAYIRMELPDMPSRGKKLSEMSEADLLIWYSQHARPRQDPGCGGFFLEELPARTPKTRLFRLPNKWAYEFILRKDHRDIWEKELPTEYTCFTEHALHKELHRLGARVQYAGPHWDGTYISKYFAGRFTLLADHEDKELTTPPTSYIAVAQKLSERKSLIIEERRPSIDEKPKLIIQAVRDEIANEIIDVVKRDDTISEVIPYYISDEGRLKIYLHDGVARSIANTVPRKGINIDGRFWSGHMIEPVAVDQNILNAVQNFTAENSAEFANDYLGLMPAADQSIKPGPAFYPAPDYIDERIRVFYLEVEEYKGTVNPKKIINYAERFQAKGDIRLMDAQQVLNAISVGLIPSGRLEMQLLYLFEHVKIRPENWTHKNVIFEKNEIKMQSSLRMIMDLLRTEENRFKDIKGSAGQLKAVHSTFVEEGQSRGAITGLSSQDVDFVVHNNKTVNTAVVLPLSEGLKEDVHAGFTIKHFPIPQRHEGLSTTIGAPSFNIPAEIADLNGMKAYIAEQFGVIPDVVFKLGESYFAHIGMTPHRIHPFAIVMPKGASDPPNTQFLPFYQFMLLRRSLSRDPHFMLLISRAYKYFHEEIRYDFARRVKAIVNQRFADKEPDWSLPLHFIQSPTAPSIERKKEKAAHNQELNDAVKQAGIIINLNPEKLKTNQKSGAKKKLKDKSRAPDDPDLKQVGVRKDKDTETSDGEGDKSASASIPDIYLPDIKEDGTKDVKLPLRSTLVAEFQAELEEFIDALAMEEENLPSPEDW